MTSRISIGPWTVAFLCGLALLAVSAGGTDAQTLPVAGQGPYFPADSPWYQDISAAPVDSESAAVIGWLAGVGGWGGGRMQIDFSIEVLEADAGTPLRGFTATADFYDPDCAIARPSRPSPCRTAALWKGRTAINASATATAT
jgi:hypothetical protein